MKHRRLFLRWSVLPSLILVGTLIVANLGWFTTLHQGDRSHISYLILLIFVVGTYLAGKIAWRISSDLTIDAKRRDACVWARKILRHDPFFRGLCERLGLLGTLIGVALMLSGGFGGVAEGGELARESIRTLTVSMATAVYTTLIGYVCSLFLWFQFHFIEMKIEDLES